jgi:hypothetical protein
MASESDPIRSGRSPRCPLTQSLLGSVNRCYLGFIFSLLCYIILAKLPTCSRKVPPDFFPQYPKPPSRNHSTYCYLLLPDHALYKAEFMRHRLLTRHLACGSAHSSPDVQLFVPEVRHWHFRLFFSRVPATRSEGPHFFMQALQFNIFVTNNLC